MRAFDVLIDVLTFVALLSQLPAFNQKGLILDRLDYAFDDGIGGHVADALPESDTLGSIDDFAVLRQEGLELLDGPQVGEDKLIVREDTVVVGLLGLLYLVLQLLVLQVGYDHVALEQVAVVKSAALGDADGPAELVASVVA
jgi:hypothetical protein